jgi:hypothetical protein
MNEVIFMSIKELDRLKILDQLEKKMIKQGQAADFLGISTRQIRGLIKAYKAHGAIGIIFKKRGNPGNRQLPKSIKDLDLNLIEANYSDFGQMKEKPFS